MVLKQEMMRGLVRCSGKLMLGNADDRIGQQTNRQVPQHTHPVGPEWTLLVPNEPGEPDSPAHREYDQKTSSREKEQFGVIVRLT